jgi:hypothetical protein
MCLNEFSSSVLHELLQKSKVNFFLWLSDLRLDLWLNLCEDGLSCIIPFAHPHFSNHLCSVVLVNHLRHGLADWRVLRRRDLSWGSIWRMSRGLLPFFDLLHVWKWVLNNRNLKVDAFLLRFCLLSLYLLNWDFRSLVRILYPRCRLRLLLLHWLNRILLCLLHNRDLNWHPIHNWGIGHIDLPLRVWRHLR